MASVSGLELVPKTCAIRHIARPKASENSSESQSQRGLRDLARHRWQCDQRPRPRHPRSTRHPCTNTEPQRHPAQWSRSIDCGRARMRSASDLHRVRRGQPTARRARRGSGLRASKGIRSDEIEDIRWFSRQDGAAPLRPFRPARKPEIDVPGSGAAGGIGFGLKVACGAEFVPGFELVAAWLDIASKVNDADLVLTGEGKFDVSSPRRQRPLLPTRRRSRSGQTSHSARWAAWTPQCQNSARTFPETAFMGSPRRYGTRRSSRRGPEQFRAVRRDNSVSVVEGMTAEENELNQTRWRRIRRVKRWLRPLPL